MAVAVVIEQPWAEVGSLGLNAFLEFVKEACPSLKVIKLSTNMQFRGGMVFKFSLSLLTTVSETSISAHFILSSFLLFYFIAYIYLFLFCS